ncbi:MerR family transcriptional regulator [Glycomyces sp. NRRL B-16210]|uniref:MerR family transcriptional regulator n=1 Tax=Glycomyces sp. NRRL B-16210 TaxID=1463821 RepID=UPI00068B5459|nr:MerR family transcriptional regulator [Glycomyces sp. NRRL B-16210]
MRIGELAKRTGVTVRALRYYEEQGLLAPTRSASGQRHYPEDAVRRIEKLQLCYGAGMSSRTIFELMPCLDSPSPERAQDAVRRLESEYTRILGSIKDLDIIRQRFEDVLATTRGHAGEGPLPVEDSRQSG